MEKKILLKDIPVGSVVLMKLNATETECKATILSHNNSYYGKNTYALFAWKKDQKCLGTAYDVSNVNDNHPHGMHKKDIHLLNGYEKMIWHKDNEVTILKVIPSLSSFPFALFGSAIVASALVALSKIKSKQQIENCND